MRVYSGVLRTYWELFPKEQLRVVFLKDFFRDPVKAFEVIEDHFNVTRHPYSVHKYCPNYPNPQTILTQILDPRPLTHH